MSEEDDRARPAKPQLRDLEAMSIEALKAYRQELEQEIARVDEKIAAKQRARAGAQSLFKL